MHIGKMINYSAPFRRQVWKRILGKEFDFFAVVPDGDGIEEAEIRIYGQRKCMVVSEEFCKQLYRDAVWNYCFSNYGAGFSLAGIPVHKAESLDEFGRVGEVTRKMYEVVR